MNIITRLTRTQIQHCLHKYTNTNTNTAVNTSIELGLALFNICDGKEVENHVTEGKKPWDTQTPEEVIRLLQEAEAEAVNSLNDRMEMAIRSLVPISRFVTQLHREDKAVDSDLSGIMGGI